MIIPDFIIKMRYEKLGKRENLDFVDSSLYTQVYE